MASREKRNLVKPSQCPSVCDYRPKYDFIDNTPVKAIKFSVVKPVKKKINMSKILCSYDVPRTYLSVDLDVDGPLKEEYNLNDF